MEQFLHINTQYTYTNKLKKKGLISRFLFKKAPLPSLTKKVYNLPIHGLWCFNKKLSKFEQCSNDVCICLYGVWWIIPRMHGFTKKQSTLEYYSTSWQIIFVHENKDFENFFQELCIFINKIALQGAQSLQSSLKIYINPLILIQRVLSFYIIRLSVFLKGFQF